MEDQACPRCKTTKYRNPSLKLMVNVCGHTLCESCVDLLFLKGSGSCPECNTALRRGNFRVQLYEDSMVEKEVDIRKRILRDFSKKEEDFASQRAYDDYLEEVENVIFNLANNVDVIETNKRIEQYKKDNREQIMRSRLKMGKKESELEEIIEMEKMEQEGRRLELAKQEIEVKRKKIRDKEALIDELMFSEDDAKRIVHHFASSMQATREEEEEEEKEQQQQQQQRKVPLAPKPTGFSTGIKFGQQSSSAFLPVPRIDDVPAYKYAPLEQEIQGPSPPDWAELVARGYIAHVRSESASERAGGFVANIACLRALQEAMAGLYHNPSKQSMEMPEES